MCFAVLWLLMYRFAVRRWSVSILRLRVERDRRFAKFEAVLMADGRALLICADDHQVVECRLRFKGHLYSILVKIFMSLVCLSWTHFQILLSVISPRKKASTRLEG